MNGHYKDGKYTENTIYFKIKTNQNFCDNESLELKNADTVDLAEAWCALRLPENYSTDGKPCRLALFCHGAGVAGTIDGENDSAIAYKRDSEVLVKNGYAVFDITGNNQKYYQHMGGRRSISAYRKAYEYICEHYNVSEYLYVLGQSMGGLTALNFAMWNKQIVRACAVAFPVTDLYRQAWLKPWFGENSEDPTRAAIAREYNFDCYKKYLQSGNYGDLEFEPDKVKGFSPIDNQSVTIDGTRYNFFPVPLKIIHGNGDRTLCYKDSIALVDAIHNAGGFAEIRIVDKMDHSIFGWLRNELLDFIDRY